MKDNRLVTLAHNIKAERSRRDMTQEQLAETIGISTQSVGLIERCIQTPSVFIAMDIAAAFGMELKELLEPVQRK